MVLEGIPTGYEIRFLIDIGIVLGAGFAIGAERESRNKPARISTHCFSNWRRYDFYVPVLLRGSKFYFKNCFTGGIRYWVLGSRHYLEE
jgi:hypothetical protein